MKQQDFENQYAEHWLQFELAISEHKQKKGNTSPHFPEHYRQICNHLSLARQRHYSEDVIRRLNAMVMAGHHILYQRDNRFRIQMLSNALVAFVTTLRDNTYFLWASTFLFLFPALLAAIACSLDETLIYSLLDSSQVREMEAMYDPSQDKIGRERGSDTDLAMFGYYIYNNIGIAFRTFAGGIFFGLGSAFFLVFNGLYFGAIATRLTQAGYSVTFYPFVIGHGAFELTAIVFAGAAGLMIGYSLVNPGNLSRLNALKVKAREAVKIMYGAAFMLFVAAFIEAFWSSSSTLPIEIKLGVGTLLWLFVFWFCFLSKLASDNPELSKLGARHESV